MRLGKLAVLLVVGLMVWPAFAAPVILNRNLGTEPPTADPALGEDTTSIEIIEHMFLGLVDLDENTMAPIPELAKSWDVSEDGLTWTFHMRNDVYWVKYDPKIDKVVYDLDKDGNKRLVTAYDVEYGVKRTIDPNTGSDYAYVLYAYVLYIIKGAYEANTADPTSPDFPALMDAVGVKALDPFTV
ncbi:MAG: hypothetical protein H5T95_14565, partial [Firmicutes bacterium]|nr:hypothetical protein [Bacillota bacterium]